MPLELIIGCMFAAKSTELLRRFQRYRIAGKSCALIKHRIDTRYSRSEVSTHDQQQVEATIVASRLREICNYEIIAIDEGHFFPDLALVDVLANEGKTVIVASIDQGLFRRQLRAITSLVPKAEKVTKLTAVCGLCKGEASFTKKIDETDLVDMVGSTDKYVSLCRPCYIKESPSVHPTTIREFEKCHQAELWYEDNQRKAELDEGGAGL